MPEIQNAGYFGASATLPEWASGAGPVEPPILPGNYPDFGPSPSPTPWAMNPSGAGMVSSSLFGNQGYVPSNIMQAYLDFYANNPQAAGATAPNYPAPGTGASAEGDAQGIMGRLFNHTPIGAIYNLISGHADRIPAVRLAQSIGNLFKPKETWQQNATRPNQEGPAAAVGNAAVQLPPGGILFGYDPTSGGGQQNPLYSTGNNVFQPVAGASADIRWLPQSGTGNWQADQTAKGFELSQPAGVPNRLGTTTDRGLDRFYNQPFQASADGSFEPLSSDPAALASTVNSRNLYQQAMQAVPMDSNGFTAQYAQRLNDWIRAQQQNNTASTFIPGLTGNTISGPPRIPGA